MRMNFTKSLAGTVLLAVFLSSFSVFAQTDTSLYKVELQVLSARDSTPVAAMDVLVKGKSKSTVTDDSGKVKWELLQQDSILLITGPGFQPEEVNVFANESRSALVILRPTVEMRERGNRIWYPVENAPGSRSEIKGLLYQSGNFSVLDQGFQGQVAGMHTIQSTGNLNAYSSVLLRGVGTSVFGTEPLYVIDGVVVTSGTLGDGGGGIGNNYGYNTSPLSEFTPYDIQSIEVLKGGAATALYGGRGANGVIQVYTKRGTAGKTRLNVGYQFGVTTPTRKLDLLSGSGFLSALDQAYQRSFNANSENQGKSLPSRDYYLNNGSNEYLTNDVASTTNTDWLDKTLQNGSHRQLDLSASGGNKLVRFFFGGNYTQAKGILKNNTNDRLSVRFNTDVTINPQFRFGSSLFFSFSSGYLTPSGNSTLGGGFADAQTISLPVSPVRFDERNRNLNPYVAFNPYFNAYNGSNMDLLLNQTHSKFDRQVFRNLGNIFLETDIKQIPGLKLRGDFGLDYYSNFDRGFRSDFSRLGAAIDANNDSVIVPSSQASDYRSVFFNLNAAGTASYSKTIEHHAIRAYGGYSFQSITNTYNGIASENFPSSFSQLVSFGSRFSGLPVGAETGVSFASHFYGIDYNLRDKYFLNLSTAFTASTRYGDKIGFRSYPSASLGWDIRKEPFFPKPSWLSEARLQISSSLVGNSLMTNNQASGYWKGNLPYIDPGQFPGRYPFSLSSRNLVPEDNWVNEAELSIGLLNNSIVGKIGYFHRKTLNAAQFYPIAPSQGIAGSAFIRNGAEITNQGLELGLDARVLKQNGVVWTVSANVATLSQKVNSTDGLRDDLTNEYIGLATIQGAGTSTFFLPRWAGFATSDEPSGLWKKGDELILDRSGKPFKPASVEEVDNARVAIKDKSSLPRFYGGLNNTLSFGNFQMDMLFTFSLGNYLLDGGERIQSYMTGETNLRPGAVNDNLFFIREGDSLLTYSNVLTQRNTTRFLHDASYIRLKNLGFAYLLKGRGGIKEARLFFRVQNALTFTAYEGWDPEALTNTQLNNTRATAIGSTFFDVPQYRTFQLGFNLSL